MLGQENHRVLGLGLGLGVLLVMGLALAAPPVRGGAMAPPKAPTAACPPGTVITVTADITQSQTWVSGNTYIVYTSTVAVQPGVVLIISPCVTVKFNTGARLQVEQNGQLLALGTEDHGITFTANNVTPAPGFWNGIQVNNYSNNNEWHYCVVEYATTGLDFGDSNGNMIDHCVFRYNGDGGGPGTGGAITGVPDYTQLLSNTLHDNEVGIHFEKVNEIDIQYNMVFLCAYYGIGLASETGESGGFIARIRDNTIHNCGTAGIRLERTAAITVQHNVIRDNDGDGIYAGQQLGLVLLDNVVRNNGGYGGYYISTQASAFPTIYDNIFCGNGWNLAPGYQFRSQDPSIHIEGNWWGTNTPTTGAEITGTVYFDPWITLAAEAIPDHLPADGVSTAVVTVTLRDTAGHDVPDGAAITLTASLGSVAPGVVTTTAGLATATFTAGATPGAAVVTAAEGCGAVVTTTVLLQTADVAIRKDGGPATAHPGDLITYTVTFSNSGDMPAANVRITDTLPAGAVWRSDTAAACGLTRLGTASPVVYTRASITYPFSCAFTVVVSVTESACGADVSNTVDIATTSPDVNPANDHDTSDTTHIQCLGVDLAIVKNDNVGPLPPPPTPKSSQRVYELLDAPGGVPWRPYVYEGDVVTYTIAYANVGTADATGVVITEIVPAHTTFAGGTAGWSPIGTSNVYSYHVGDLPQAHGGVVYFAVRIDSPLSGCVDAVTLVNRACIASDQPDYDFLNNCSSDDTPVHCAYELQVAKTSDPCGFPGRTLAYTITYQNVGSRAAPGVLIQDYLPAHTAYAGGSEWTPAGGNVYTHLVGDVPAGAGGSVPFRVLVNRPLSDTVTAITNTACISNVCATVVTPLPFEPDLAVVKNDNVGPLSTTQQARTWEILRYLYGEERARAEMPSADQPLCVNPGDDVAYTMVYANAGRSAAADVVLTETLPLYTAYVGGGWTHAGGRTYTFPVGDLAPGAGWQVEFRVRVIGPIPIGVTRLVNVVDIGSATPELCNRGNNSSNDDTPICGASRLYLPLVLKGYTTQPPTPTPVPTVPPPPPPPWVSDVEANSATGRVYVASPRGRLVHVIQDSLVHTEAATYLAGVPVGNHPTGLAVVTTTNKTYATNMYDWTVSVIGAGNTVIATIPVGAGPAKAAAHNRDARVYTTNYWQLLDGVTAIDSRTDAVLYHLNRTHATQGRYGIDVNPDSDKVYVAARDAGLIAIFNGDWPTTEPLIFKLDPPRVPFMAAYNPGTGHLFVTCGADDKVVVLDPAAIDLKNARVLRIEGQEVYLLDESNAGWIATIPVGDGPEEGLAVNPFTNRVYVTNMYSDSMSVLQDDANPANVRWLMDIPVGDEPRGVGVNPGFDHIYVGNAISKTLSIIDGATNAVIQTLPLP